MSLVWLKLKLVRAQWMILMLAVLLQRSPAVRILSVLEKSLSRPIARIVQGTTWLATTMGVFHATAGATQLSTAPLDDGSGVFKTTVGDYFQLAFTVTGAPADPARWEVEGRIAPGLEVKSPSVSVSNSGVSAANGSYEFNGSKNGAVAYSRFNQSGNALYSLILEQAGTGIWSIVEGSPNGAGSTLYRNSSPSNSSSGFSPDIDSGSWTVVGGATPAPTSANADRLLVDGKVNGEWLVMEGHPTEADIFNYVMAVRAYNAQGDTTPTPHEIQVNVSEPDVPPGPPKILNTRWEGGRMIGDLFVSTGNRYRVDFSDDIQNWTTQTIEWRSGQSSQVYTAPFSQWLEDIELGDEEGFYVLVEED